MSERKSLTRSHPIGRWMAAALALALLAPGSALAAPGDLDTSFGNGGRVTSPIGAADARDQARAMARQADGSIVVAGVTNPAAGGPQDFAVARYTPRGRLDPSFSDDGIAVVDFGADDRARSVFVRPDGAIVVAGGSDTRAPGAGPRQAIAVARFTPAGNLDTGFSDDGKALSPFFAAFEQAAPNKFAMQADGKLIAAGFASGPPANGGDIAVARYNTDGSPDPTFDGDGEVLTSFERPNGTDQLFDVAVLEDGKIVGTGQAQTGPGPNGFDAAVVRYNRDGTLDSTFDGDGRASAGTADVNEAPRAIGIQADGKIVVAGSLGTGVAGGDFDLFRFNPDGSLDTSFSGDGRQSSDFGNTLDIPDAVAFQDDGRILVAGTIGEAAGPTGIDMGVARYNPGGALDPSFGGGDGVATAAFGPGQAFDAGVDAVVDANGITVVGYAAMGATGDDFALARFQARPPGAALAITRATGPKRVRRGSVLTYRLTVRNRGPAASTGTALTAVLPRTVRAIDATFVGSGDCARRGKRVTCDLGRLASGVQRRVTLRFRPKNAGKLTARFSVRSSNLEPGGAGPLSRKVTTTVLR